MATGNPDHDLFDAPVFTAVIRPHRSLGQGAFRVVMTLCCLATVFAGLVFVAFGLWPIAGFFGLDLLALYIAFRVNFRDGRRFEEIVLTRFEFLCRHVNHHGRERDWRCNPLWMRLHREHRDDEFGLMRLAVTSRGERVVIARDLSPAERESLAHDLGTALADVKRGY